MEISEVRRRVRAAIEQARRDAHSRRERIDAVTRDYREFLASRAVPAFNALASALVGEGHRFKVFTPAESVRLAADGSDDFIELMLDSSEDPPIVLGRANVGRGRRAITRERPVSRSKAVADLTEDDIIEFVLSEIGPLVER